MNIIMNVIIDCNYVTCNIHMSDFREYSLVLFQTFDLSLSERRQPMRKSRPDLCLKQCHRKSTCREHPHSLSKILKDCKSDSTPT